MNRQRLILLVCLVLLAGTLVFSYILMPRQQTVAQLKNVPGSRATTARGSTIQNKPVQLDERLVHLSLLERDLPRFAGFRRNIFSPIFREESKVVPLPPPPPPPATKPPEKPSVPPPPPPPPVEIPQVQRDMARFTFLGFMKKDNRKTIFLSNESEIFLVRKGDRMLGRYEVANITDEALTIGILTDGGQIIIPLVENKPLTAAQK